jgi:hypothetical protein
MAREFAIMQLSSESSPTDGQIMNLDFKKYHLPDGTKVSPGGAMLLGPDGNIFPEAVSDISAVHLSHLATEDRIHDAITEAMHPSNYHDWVGMNSAEHLQGLKDLFYIVYGRKHEAPLSFREMISLTVPASPKQTPVDPKSRFAGLNPLAVSFEPRVQ